MALQTSKAKQDPRGDDPVTGESGLFALARRVADGRPLATDDGLETDEAEVLEQLKVLARVAEAHSRLATLSGETTGYFQLEGARTVRERRWDRLELQEHRGHGAFGDVYRAWDPDLDREVALKIVSRRSAGDDASVLLEEGRLLAKVKHPNVVTVFGAKQVGDEVGIWSEFLHGRNLAEIVERDGPLGAAEAAMIGVGLCQALSAVHKSGLLHRDVKATNVIREKGGRIVLVDFGAGRRVETRGGDLHGTPLYMAPELFAGKAASVRTDIYSVGVLLYYLVTGRYPVEGGSAQEIQELHEQGKARRLRDQRPELPEAFVRVVERAIAPKPEDRFASDGHLEVELARSIGVGTVDPGFRRGPSSALSRIVLAGVLAALLFAWAWSLAERREAATEPVAGPIVVEDIRDLTHRSDFAVVSLAMTDWLSTTLAAIPGLIVAEEVNGAKPADSRYIVKGSVYVRNESVLATVQLVDAIDSTVLWSAPLQGDPKDLFSIQTRAADRLLEGMQLARLITKTQVVAVQERMRELPTESALALDNYLRAGALLERIDFPENLDKAVELLNVAVSEDPVFALGHARLAEALWITYERRNELEAAHAARSHAEEAHELAPSAPRVVRTLSRVLAGLGHFDEAIFELRDLVEFQPATDEGYRQLALVLGEAGRFDEAAEAADEAVLIRPGFAPNYAVKGWVHFLASQWQLAAEAFEKETQIQEDNADAWQRYATALQNSGRVEDAVVALEKSIELQPSETAFSNLATIRFERRDFVGALIDYRRAIELGPRNPVSHRNAANALEALGDSASATSHYELAASLSASALEIDPSDVSMRALSGYCLAKLGRTDEALDALGQSTVTAEVPTSTVVVIAAGYAVLGELDASVAALRAALAQGYPRPAIEKDPDFSEVLQRL